jgi:hypothetical protein
VLCAIFLRGTRRNLAKNGLYIVKKFAMFTL